MEEYLPSQAHHYPWLPALSQERLHVRRENVFLILSGLFLGTLTMLNIIGITRFVDLSFTLPLFDVTIPMPLAVGVLPYPVTFLCTDFISELYGRRRANHVVMIGLGLNMWVVFILWLGGALPGSKSAVYDGLQTAAFSAVWASMIAYLVAQFLDVELFHFWKRVTRGKHLWLRNNGSTLISQLVDTIAVILATHYLARGLPGIDEGAAIIPQLMTFILSGYTFKLVVALADTLPFYLGISWLTKFLRLPPPGEELWPEGG